MRTRILALVAAAALAQAPAALAQVQTPSSMEAPIPQGTGTTLAPLDHDTWQDRYDLAVMMLKKKVDRVTRGDGGRLTSEHQASLQAELDKLNRSFGRKVASR